MRRTRDALILCVVVVAACAPKTLTPDAQKVFVAISIVDGLQALQSAAIDANKLQVMSDADSVAIVTFTRGAAVSAAKTPEGWKASLITGWEELRAKVPTDRIAKSPTLRILWASFDTLVKQLKGTV